MTERDVLKIFEHSGALLQGHFRLASGLHSDKFLQSSIALQYPQIADKLTGELASRFSGDQVRIVVGPAIGGVIIAQGVARALGARAIFTERIDGVFDLRLGFKVSEGERMLVVDDVITRGGSVNQTIRAVRSRGGMVVGVGVLIDRSGGNHNLNLRLESLARLELDTYDPEKCPLCAAGSIAIKP